MSSVHPACDNAGKTVTCDRCRRTYVCTPSDDYYCTPDDHCCEACLIGGLPVFVVEVATCRHCGHSISRRPGRDWWEDASGWTRCMKAGVGDAGNIGQARIPGHEPMPGGLAGAPVEVPGTPSQPDPQWRLL